MQNSNFWPDPKISRRNYSKFVARWKLEIKQMFEERERKKLVKNSKKLMFSSILTFEFGSLIDLKSIGNQISQNPTSKSSHRKLCIFFERTRERMLFFSLDVTRYFVYESNCEFWEICWKLSLFISQKWRNFEMIWCCFHKLDRLGIFIIVIYIQHPFKVTLHIALQYA